MTNESTSSPNPHAREIIAGERFAFGANRAVFLGRLDAECIRVAEVSRTYWESVIVGLAHN